MLIALLVLVPLTALGLVLGMGRLEDSLLTAPVAADEEPPRATGSPGTAPVATLAA